MPNQFAFGTELLVAPITTPRDPVTLRGAVRAWLPPGIWIDIFTGDRLRGRPRRSSCTATLGSIPALLRGGGILPLAAEDDLDATRNPERLELLVAPGADGSFTLIEDDGTGATPEDIPAARTPIALGPGGGQADDRPGRGPARGAAGRADVDGALPRPRRRAGAAAGPARRAAVRRGRRRPAAAHA